MAQTGDDLRHVQPGDPLTIPANAYNAFIDAANTHNSDKLRRGRDDVPELNPFSGIVLLQNTSGADRTRFEILGIDVPIIDRTTMPREFFQRPALKGVAPVSPTHDRMYAVLLEPISNNKIGRAILMGVVPVLVEMVNEGHRFADLNNGDATKLKSSASGTAQLLWIEPVGDRAVAGIAMAIARIGPPGSIANTLALIVAGGPDSWIAYSQPAAQTIVTETVLVRTAAASANVLFMRAGLTGPCTSVTTCTVALLKNDVSIAGSLIDLKDAAAFNEITVDFSGVTVAASDTLKVEVTATVGGGTMGLGVFATVVTDEVADHPDNRYWVRSAQTVNVAADGAEAEVVLLPIMDQASPDFLHVTATNFAERALGTHLLPTDGSVAIDLIDKAGQRPTSPLSPTVPRYAFTFGAVALAVLGGTFTAIDSLRANGVALHESTSGWLDRISSPTEDAFNWNATGSAWFDPGSGEKLFVCGTLTIGPSTGADLAYWDGAKFVAVTGHNFSVINTLIVWDDGGGLELYAGGTGSGGSPQAVRKWDGTTWTDVGTGPVPGGAFGADVKTFAIWGSDLYVGGLFRFINSTELANSIAKWSGSAWSALDEGVVAAASNLGPVHAIAPWDSGNGEGERLYVVGDFNIAGGDSGVSGFANAAAWDGSAWIKTGNGLPGSGEVKALVPYRDGYGAEFLYAGGKSVAGNPLARFNGEQWVAVGESLTHAGSGKLAIHALNVITHHGKRRLLVGGEFTHLDRGSLSLVGTHFLEWDSGGGTLVVPGGGVNGPVRAMAIGGGKVQLGGDFTLPFANLAEYDRATDTFSSLGSLGGVVRALIWFDDGSGNGSELYAGGDFPGYLKRRRDDAWSTIGALNGPVHVLADKGSGDILFVGGEFTADGATSIEAAAEYHRTTGLSVIGTGGGFTSTGGPDPVIRAIKQFSGDWYFAGRFDEASGASVPNIAQFDTGADKFVDVSSGVDGSVFSLEVFDSLLWVGFQGANAGGGSADWLATWSGSAWAEGLSGLDKPVHALVVHSSKLHVDGDYTPNSVYSGLETWDGVSTRSLLDGAILGDLLAMASGTVDGGTRLYVGGAVAAAGTLSVETEVALSLLTFDEAGYHRFEGGVGIPYHVGFGTGGGIVFHIGVSRVGPVQRIAAVGLFLAASGHYGERICILTPRGLSPLGVGFRAASVGATVVERTMVFEGLLYAAGEFTKAVNPPGSGTEIVTVANVAVFDRGELRDAGGGVSGKAFDLTSHPVSSTERLMAAVSHTSTGGVYYYDGSTWTKLGGAGLPAGDWRACQDFDTGSGRELWAGRMIPIGGGEIAYHWNGTSWTAASPPNGGVGDGIQSVRDFVVGDIGSGDELFCGGENPGSVSDPDTPIFVWNGTSWDAIGTNLTGDCFELFIFRGDLYAVGTFTLTGPSDAEIVKYDAGADTFSAVGVVGSLDVPEAIGRFPIGLFGHLAVGGSIGLLDSEPGMHLFSAADGDAFDPAINGRTVNDEVSTIDGPPA